MYANLTKSGALLLGSMFLGLMATYAAIASTLPAGLAARGEAGSTCGEIQIDSALMHTCAAIETYYIPLLVTNFNSKSISVLVQASGTASQTRCKAVQVDPV